MLEMLNVSSQYNYNQMNNWYSTRFIIKNLVETK